MSVDVAACVMVCLWCSDLDRVLMERVGSGRGQASAIGDIPLLIRSAAHVQAWILVDGVGGVL